MGARPASVGMAKMEASHGLGTAAQVQWRLVQEVAFKKDVVYMYYRDLVK
eukprot:SAG11_NODE_951_length_6407_cov_15.903614_1_plen_50_part_00